jgi:hypothetical protein
MVEEKEPKGITRRQFLKGITALGASALLSSCGVKEEPVSQKPTETLRPAETTPPTKVPTQESSPTPQSTLTPESTPTPEITRIAGLTITADYLKNAFAGIGGEEVITNGQEEVSVVQFGQEYVSQSWGEEIDFTKLAEDPVASLKYLISLGAYRGEEGVFTPGKQGEEVIFPQLKDLSLVRLTLDKVPSEEEQKEQDYREWISPLNLTLRPQTQMTVIGLLNEPRPEAEVTVDKEAPGEKLNYALVAFTDYLRASEEGVLRHYLALLPAHFPADPENKNTLSLKNLLEANGYQYDSQNKEIAVVDQDNQKTALALNQIEGEELIKDLRKATGLAFVDQMKGELIKNPLVPYPDQMPAVWEIKEETDEDGTISLLLQGQDEKGEMVAVAKASYDQEEEKWRWEKAEAEPAPASVLSPEEEQQLKEDIIRIFEPYGGEQSESCQSILRSLEEAKKYDPQKFPENLQQYGAYTDAIGVLVGIYFASGDSPENRNQEVLKVLAQIRELARSSPYFDEEQWKVEGVDSY